MGRDGDERWMDTYVKMVERSVFPQCKASFVDMQKGLKYT